MSTKIYNAYQCKLGFPYLHLIITQLREEYTASVREYMKIVPRGLRKECVKKYLKDGIIIYPLQDGRILFQIWDYERPYKALMPTLYLMLTFDKIQDWHYQNQTDPWYVYEDLKGYDLAMAKHEYIQREKDWDEIFDKTWVAAEAGYFIPFIKDKIKLEW